MSVTQKLEARLADLQQRFEALQSRVERLEARVGSEAPAPGEAVHLDLHGDEAEYWIGARFLPRLGAVLIVLAIAFLAISETSKNAAVDRSIVLLLETMFCLGFIAVGEWRRDESEGFGKTLTAIGSCGLFLTAAGAHFAYHTLSAAGMAAVFALLALLNHGYAVWRNTRLFFGIGATGGVAAMLFPLAEKDYSTGLALYLTVTIAAALACAVRKWMGLAFMGWLSGLAIIAPVVMSDYSRTAIVGGLYLGSLACIGAYVHSNTEEELDIAPVGAALMFLLTGLVGFSIQPGLSAIPNVAGFGLIGMGLALRIYRSNFAARCLFVGAAATVAVIVPLALPPVLRSPAFVAIAVLVLLASPRLDWRLAGSFAATAFGAAVAAYVRWGVGAASENALLGFLLLGLLATSWTFKRASIGWISFTIGGLWLLLARWSVVAAPAAGVEIKAFSLPTIVSVAYSLVLLVLGFRLHSSRLRIWSIAVMLASVIQILAFETGTSAAFRLAALVILGGVMLFAGHRYVQDRAWETAKDQESAAGEQLANP